jgi:recombination protein RecR
MTNGFPDALDRAINQMATLPGVGRKSAVRLVLELLRRSPEDVQAFGEAFTQLLSETHFCHTCGNVSETDVCGVCTDPQRDGGLICVVQDIRDVIAIENTRQYKGKYHVLGGLISPMDGVGPSDLNIQSLIDRVTAGGISEIILALSAQMEGETTSFYLFKKLGGMQVSITTLARGLSVGSELEYADEITLSRSIAQRLPYENAVVRS